MAKIPVPENRREYKPSGKARWPIFIFMAFGVLALTLLMAFVLALFGQWGWHIMIVVPLLLATPVGGAMYGTIYLSHCRNAAAPALLGLIAGLLFVPGRFQMEIALQLGPDALTRIDALPGYIHQRMATQKLTKVGQPANNRPPDTVDMIFNYFFLAVEGLLVVGMTMVPVAILHRRPYSEHRGMWMTSVKFRLPAGIGNRLASSMAEESLEDFDAIIHSDPPPKKTAHCEVKLFYPPSDDELPFDYESGDDLYLSATELTVSDKNKAFLRDERFWAWALDPEEIDAVKDRIPNAGL